MDVAYTGVKECEARVSARDGNLILRMFRYIFGAQKFRCNRLSKRQLPPGRRLRRPAKVNPFHSFLKRLRAGGRSNMYGAIPYLMRAFAIDRDRAFRVVCEWVDLQADDATERPAEPSTRS